jgi:hypothetical protein
MMRARVSGLLYFLLVIAAVIVSLLLLHWLPTALQQDTLRKYDSIEEVRAKLNMRDLRVPTYFPQSITWPAGRILAQAKPYPAVLMVFNRAGRQEPWLVLSQAASGSFSEDLYITFAEIKEKVPYQLKGRKAVLEVGTGRNGETCSRISWTEGDLKISLIMKSPPFELIRIAESMVH